MAKVKQGGRKVQEVRDTANLLYRSSEIATRLVAISRRVEAISLTLDGANQELAAMEPLGGSSVSEYTENSEMTLDAIEQQLSVIESSLGVG